MFPMKSPGKQGWHALTRNWDLCVSVLLAISFCVTSLIRGEELKGIGPILIAGVAAGVAIGTTTLVASRWVTDLLTKGEYGELVRAIDWDESKVRHPYEIVSTTSFSMAGLSVVNIIIYQAIPSNLLIISTSILLGLGMYAILGSITLIRITRRHSSRAAKIRSIKEKNVRDQRMRKWNKENDK